MRVNILFGYFLALLTGAISPNCFAIYAAVELTPETPGFVRVWSVEEKAGFVQVAFAVDKNDPDFRRSKAAGVSLELRDKSGPTLQTDIGSSAAAKSAVVAFARGKTIGAELDEETKQFLTKDNVAFYWLMIRRSHLANSRIVIRAERPLQTDVEYWFSLNRFHTRHEGNKPKAKTR